jgi:hypothetical protein
MKKRNLNSLLLNKQKISELQGNIGGRSRNTEGCPTIKHCTGISTCNIQTPSYRC